LASTSFDQLGLIAPLVQAVRDLGYEQPTPVQEQAIPLVLAGRDLMAGAQTGTGKTAAFALPILQRLAPQASSSASPARHPVRALILTPTRELAIQVEQSFRDYGKHLPLRSAVVYGGADMNAQIQQLRRGVEVLVATPGRLLDHVQSKTVMLNQVGILTLDEADRMLDMGFLPDIRRIIALLPQVINFDIPHSPEDYIHRIGRTGRAGAGGEAISLVAPTDLEALAAIERLIKKKLDRVLVPGFQPDGGTAATLMGKEARRPSRREAAPREAAPRPMAPKPQRPMAPKPQRPQGDPIFSTPYEPSTASASAAPQAEVPQQSKRRQPQVAALLGGGLKRA